MTVEEIRELIAKHIADVDVQVHSEDGVHFSATVITSAFTDLSAVKRQQLVYAAVAPHIHNGTIHALSLQTYTPQQWAEQQNG